MKILKYIISLLVFISLSTSGFADVIYRIRKGDSLDRIARKFNTTTGKIIAKNRLKPPYIIYPGKKLIIPTRQRRTAYKIYRVRKGDSIGKIAKKFGVSVKKIAKANNLRKPYRIYVRQKLKIPVKTSYSTVKTKRKKIVSYAYYKIRKGDSLDKIAKKFNTTIHTLIKANKLKKPYRIYVGHKLKVPVYATVKKAKKENTTQKSVNISAESTNSMLRKVPIYKYYRVGKGDSIGKIAKKFGVSVKSIRRTNNLKNYLIRPGQKLKILVGYKDRLALNRPLEFKIPVDGRIDTTIREKGYKGIFIVTPPEEPVEAAEVGIVKFAGKDDKLLKKFGNTVILEHPQNYTTIYASLDTINVKPGQLVHRGEIIGTSGVSGNWRRSGIYFEISKIHNGKAYPLNPLEILR